VCLSAVFIIYPCILPPPQAFAKQSAESFQEDEAPFVVKNCLGLPVSILYSEMFSPIGREGHDHTVELQDGESLNMDYLRSTTDSDQFSAITSLSSKDYYIKPSEWQPTTSSYSLVGRWRAGGRDATIHYCSPIIQWCDNYKRPFYTEILEY